MPAGVPCILLMVAVLCVLAGFETASGIRRRLLKENLGLAGTITSRSVSGLRQKAKNKLLRYIPQEWTAAERERLGRAGLHPEPEIGLSIRLMAATCCGVVGVLLSVRHGMPGSGRLTAAVAVSAMVGLACVDWWLARRARSRLLALRSDWPDFLHQLRLCLLGGMSIEQALVTLSTYPDPGRSRGLSAELLHLTAHISSGTSVEAALAGLARNTGLEEVEAFSTSVERSRALGVPLTDTLARQVQLGRARLRHGYLAWLNSLPSRLSFCAMIFFLPAVLVVVLLPNILAFLRSGW